MTDLLVRAYATISEDGLYRYRLERFWSGEHALPFVMLNPSTADAETDDPTIRRCIGFARRERAGGIIVANLFGLRATNPRSLSVAKDPFGPENAINLDCIAGFAFRSGMPIVAAWGGGSIRSASIKAMTIFKRNGCRVVCLGKTKHGFPRHPLYVRADQPLEPFS